MVPRHKEYLRDKQSDQLKFWPYQISFFFLNGPFCAQPDDEGWGFWKLKGFWFFFFLTALGLSFQHAGSLTLQHVNPQVWHVGSSSLIRD